MAYIINDRSKKILDILIKSNVDISKLSILRKTAADWTREEAENMLVDREGSSYSSYIYNLGSFFKRPVMGGTPAYQLYPDLGVAAAKKLIERHKKEPLSSAFYTIIHEDIDEKVPEVAQDIVDIVIANADEFTYFSSRSNFFKKYPEALRPLMYNMLINKAQTYFYFINKYKNSESPMANMVNQIRFPDAERDTVAKLVSTIDKAPESRTSEYDILFKYEGWTHAPEAARSIMKGKIRDGIRWVGNATAIRKYLAAYPEVTREALQKWAGDDPVGFISGGADVHDATSLQIALDSLAEHNSERFFHVVSFRGEKHPSVYFSGKINYEENVIRAAREQLESKPEFFISMKYWREVFEKTNIPPIIDEKLIEELAMDSWLEELNAIKPDPGELWWDTAVTLPGRSTYLDADDQQLFLRNINKLFEEGGAYGIDLKERFTKYMDHPTVVEMAGYYAQRQTLRFFENKLYKYFPEVGNKNILKYIKHNPLMFFKSKLNEIYPEHIDVALSEYKALFGSDPGPASRTYRAQDQALLNYFKFGLDAIDTKESRRAEVLRMFERHPEKAIRQGLAEEYSDILINFIDPDVDISKYRFGGADFLFHSGAASAMMGAADDDNADRVNKIISNMAYSLAENNPLTFFSMQMNGKQLFYYRTFLDHLFAKSEDSKESMIESEAFREETFNIMMKKEDSDPKSIIANLYPEFREIALAGFLQKGRVDSFYEAIKEFDIDLPTEDEKALLDEFVYTKAASASGRGNSLRITGSRSWSEIDPGVNAFKLFKYIRDSGNSEIENRHSEFLKQVAKDIAGATHPNTYKKEFRKYKLHEKYPDIRFENIIDLRDISNKEDAMLTFNKARNDLVEDPPSHIKINVSMYQADQRPDDWIDTTRYTISQNNTSPTDVLYDINKKLIHAADGVPHSNVGASGFTSAWALVSILERPTRGGIADVLEGYSPDDDELSDVPKNALVIEQYQSDYPVVYDRMFLGNERDDDGSIISKDYGSLDNLIKSYLDIDTAEAWIKSHSDELYEVWENHISKWHWRNYENTDKPLSLDTKRRILEEFFMKYVQPAGEVGNPLPAPHLPIEIAPQVRDVRAHFDTITKAYPYLVLMNTIEVAKMMGDKYIYIIKNAPFYASIQNKEKAKKLYKTIPELVATERSMSKPLRVVSEEPYTHYEEAYEIPATDESIAILRSEAERVTGKGAAYDFSLTPAQNKAKRVIHKKDRSWNPTPEKIEKLKELTNFIKIELGGVDVPEFYDPVSAIKYLSKDIRSKIVPKKRFHRIFGPIIGEPGKLSRASRLKRLIDEMFIKTSSTISDRRKALRKFLIFNVMSATN